MNYNNRTFSLYHVWTKPLWNIIHTIGSILDTVKHHNIEIFEYAKSFFDLLIFVVPCNECKKHLYNFYQQFIIYNTDSFSYFIYTNQLHNNVNNLLRKPLFSDITKMELLYSVKYHRNYKMLKSYVQFYFTFCKSQKLLVIFNVFHWFYQLLQIMHFSRYLQFNHQWKETFVHFQENHKKEKEAIILFLESAIRIV